MGEDTMAVSLAAREGSGESQHGILDPLDVLAPLLNVTVNVSNVDDYWLLSYDQEDDNTTSVNTSLLNTSLQHSEEWAYCSTEGWDHFHHSYQALHGCLALVVCVFGSLANMINMAVLTRRSMLSPTNAILTGLAVTDLLVMAEYVPYTLHQYVWRRTSLTAQFSWGWAVFVLFHAHFCQVFHTISIWLTVTLAVWRYIAVAYPQHNSTWCSMSRTHTTIMAAFLSAVLLNIPNYLNFSISRLEHEGQTLHMVGFSQLALAHGGFLKSINFWVYAVMLKLLPCAALTGLSYALIEELLQAARRRARLIKRKPGTGGRSPDAEKQADRVTRMLLAILFLFLASEVPQGILGLLTVIPDSGFFPCYQKLGEIMDMLVLFNSAINFLLYCAMSQQFRDTFTQLFRPRCMALTLPRTSEPSAWRPIPRTDPGTQSNSTCITNV